MAKIKVGELRNLKGELNEQVNVHNFQDLEIEVKVYLPINEKVNLIGKTYLSLVDTDGFSAHLLDVIFNVYIVEYYTNISLPKDTSEAYDLITQTGIFDFVYSKLDKREIAELKKMMEEYIQVKKEEERQKNTLSSIVNQAIEALGDKLPSQENTDALIQSLIK